jgi:hypothetical protein
MMRNFISGSRISIAGIVGLLFVAGGCSQEYVGDISFYPHPAIVRVVHNGSPEQSPLTVEASIDGIRRADPNHNVMPAVVVKLKFQSNGPSQVVFEPNSLELENGSLTPFPPPQVQPPGDVYLAPGQQQQITAIFPLPPPAGPQGMDLTNLRLRWMVRIDNYPVPQTALFEQQVGGSSAAVPPPAYGGDVAY